MRHPRYAGFVSFGRESYVTSAAQVLLRIPAVAVFLEHHAGLCDAGAQKGCVTCALWATRLELQGRDVPTLVCNRAFVDERFRESMEEHDVAEFLQQLIHGMSRVEAAASRALENPYGSAVENGAVITHVERLFGFLEEGRRRTTLRLENRTTHLG